MQSIGKIINYDGTFGTIQDQQDQIEFSKNDVLDNHIMIGDIVLFRKEKRDPNLILARYITVLKQKKEK